MDLIVDDYFIDCWVSSISFFSFALYSSMAEGGKPSVTEVGLGSLQPDSRGKKLNSNKGINA